MVRKFILADGKVLEQSGRGDIIFYIAPSEEEKKALLDEHLLDAHTLSSCFDPNELSRLEFEQDHAAIIIKRPKRYASEDQFHLKVFSLGLFLFKDKLVIVATEDCQLLEGRQYQRIRSLPDLLLRIIYNCIVQFEQHLGVIRQISDELEGEINRSTDNKHLLFMFNLEKSLVYYVSAISSNSRVIERLKASAPKVGFTADEMELLDDAAIESAQCYEQGNVYSEVLSSMMDARVSIVSNNLNILIKRLTIYMISIMIATLTVSIFSMNVANPFSGDTSLVPFWIILAATTVSAGVIFVIWRVRKW